MRPLELGPLLVAGMVALCACGSEPPANDAHTPSKPTPPAVMNEDSARVLVAINADRSARELPPVELVEDTRPLDTAAEMIRRGSPPDIALRTALGRLVEAESSEGRGWCVPTEDLAEPPLPSRLLEDDELTLAVVVVRTPAEKAATPYVVCYLVVEDGQDLQGK